MTSFATAPLGSHLKSYRHAAGDNTPASALGLSFSRHRARRRPFVHSQYVIVQATIKKPYTPPRTWPEVRSVQHPHLLANFDGQDGATRIDVGGEMYNELMREGFYFHEGEIRKLGSRNTGSRKQCAPQEPDELWRPLWCDRFMLVVEKGPGLLSAPGKTVAECLITSVTDIPEFSKARIVHRLDRDTSGVMVLALTDKTHRSLSIVFQERKVKKTYVALVAGWVQAECGQVDLPIGKNPEAGGEGPRMMIDKENGRSSMTKFSVVARLETPFKRTLVQLEPVTGRTHQLRLHMKAMGHPIVGDTLHAPPALAAECSRLCLHAHSLALDHPVTGERLEWQATCPF